ncbi:flagellar basal body rod protein FlgB [Phyllobacterium sp. 0TCS1.6C]|uniref:flagellar basal body rod protein FlgB n=1 Tax=unclassified Phyllobacterium TaxID=2638441 RepID=UPI002264B4CF|nr:MULTISPECIES: flagellar basal body rod protein FlgB [unclassified Phyllobacterium]MCX8280940.1 flagellar basal body rod protein FlgB [Phyllobacterium sp. 0TCS1.6C]MCX8295806.1 flagellar basal body rod protein FlgB [Phyllobacterium sp. 0TCS1.6A]
MQGIYLFDLASRQAEWLSVRQAAVSGNVANVNTPGFKARDVDPFREVLAQTQMTMAATDPRHLEVNASGLAATTLRKDAVTEQNHSKNTVNLEMEMVKSGEINREFALNTSIVKAFHRMMLSSVKG